VERGTIASADAKLSTFIGLLTASLTRLYRKGDHQSGRNFFMYRWRKKPFKVKVTSSKVRAGNIISIYQQGKPKARNLNKGRQSSAF
jgi:hypothetical protein